jgi:hypothetical protein
MTFSGFFPGSSMESIAACGKFARQKNKIAETERPPVALISQIGVC